MAEYQFRIDDHVPYPQWPIDIPEILIRSPVSRVEAVRPSDALKAYLERRVVIIATPNEYVAQSEFVIDAAVLRCLPENGFDRRLATDRDPVLADWAWFSIEHMKKAFHGYVNYASPRFRRPANPGVLPRGASISALHEEPWSRRLELRLERRSIDPHFLYGVLRYGILNPARVTVTYDPDQASELNPLDLRTDPCARW